MMPKALYFAHLRAVGPNALRPTEYPPQKPLSGWRSSLIQTGDKIVRFDLLRTESIREVSRDYARRKQRCAWRARSFLRSRLGSDWGKYHTVPRLDYFAGALVGLPAECTPFFGNAARFYSEVWPFGSERCGGEHTTQFGL